MQPTVPLVSALPVLVAVLMTSVACDSGSANGTPGTVNVVAGENFWGSVASQIGGSHVYVTSIVRSDPNADPHLYESSAANAAAVAQAQLVIENGAGYDDFLSRLLAAAGGNRTVLSVQDVLRITGSDVNPHFWYDIPRVPKVAGAIEAALAKVDPEDAASFQSNLATFDDSLQPIQAVINDIRRRHASAPVAYTERVPGYLLIAAGLDIKTPPGFASAIEDGNEPSPGDTAAMSRLISSHGVQVLLYNAQTVSAVTKNVQALAYQAGIPVVPVTETLPPSYPSYQEWQLAQVRALLQALGG